MNLLIVIGSALLPAILLWVYIWKKDPHPEPTRLLVKAVLWGVAIGLPVSMVEMGIQSMLFGVDGQPTSLVGTTSMAFFVAALPEESFKLLVLWLLLRKNPYFDEHFDGIVYAVCVGSPHLRMFLTSLAMRSGCRLLSRVRCWLFRATMPSQS